MPLDRITQFDRWFRSAKAGSAFIYHEGYLPVDKAHSVFMHGSWWQQPRGEVDVIAATAWLEYLNGKLELVQRRVAPQHFQYIAVKRSKVRPVKWIGGRFD